MGEPVVQVGMMPADTKEVPGHLQVLSLEAGPLPPSRFTPHPHPHPQFSLSPRTASLFGFSKRRCFLAAEESFLCKGHGQGKGNMHSLPLKVIFHPHHSLEQQVLLIPRKASRML